MFPRAIRSTKMKHDALSFLLRLVEMPADEPGYPALDFFSRHHGLRLDPWQDQASDTIQFRRQAQEQAAFFKPGEVEKLGKVKQEYINSIFQAGGTPLLDFRFELADRLSQLLTMKVVRADEIFIPRRNMGAR